MPYSFAEENKLLLRRLHAYQDKKTAQSYSDYEMNWD
jgi:hypothetical protein